MDKPVRSPSPARSNGTHAGNRSERTITTHLIGLRQADTSQVPPDRARYGLPRPTLSSVRRTVRPCSWAGLLAVGELVVGDEGGVARLGADLGEPAGRAERLVPFGEEGGVGGGEDLPLGRHVIVVEDGLHRTDRLAGAAVHALLGVDVEHAVALVDAVDRTLFDAGLVLDVDAGLGDDIGHLRVDPLVGVYSG